MASRLVVVVALAIGVPNALAAYGGEASAFKNDHVGNAELRGEIADGLDDNMLNRTRSFLSKTIYHRSGVRFPDALVDRFDLDLAGQRTFTKCEGWGPSRPKMPRAIKGEKENREMIQSAAMFWNTVREKGAVVYEHHYHPDWKGNDGKYGIDCSNFVAYIYNLVLGVTFTSSIEELSKLSLPHVTEWENMEPGDVALFTDMARTRVTHTGIVVDGAGKPSVVHSTGGEQSGPQLSSSRNWWPISRFAYGFRMQDLIGCKDPNCVPQWIHCHSRGMSDTILV